MTNFAEAMSFRHACKQFDPQKKISEDEFKQILEFGRLSPSSFGMEQWKFIVIKTPALRKTLQPAIWNQPQVVDASHLVVYLAKTADVMPYADYQVRLFKRRGLPEEATNTYLERYENHINKEVLPHMSLYAWSSKQCYIALANMLTGAASMGIDSCPLEGFSKNEVEELLEIDTKQYEVAVLAAFGYRLNPQGPHLRQDLGSLVEFR